MDSSESFLKTVLERLRGYLDDADFEAKYNDQYLLQHIVMPSIVDVQARLSLNAENPVLLKFNISLVKDQECYTLPPCVGEVLRVVKFSSGSDDNGLHEREWTPRGMFAVGGPGWILEGNMICFRPFPDVAEDITVLYLSNGDMRPHYYSHSGPGDPANGYLTTTTTFTLAGVPTLGLLDKRPNAYAGQTLRLYGANVHEERIITAYNTSTRVATVGRPFTLSVSNYSYEVAPPNFQSMTEAVTLASAIKLGTWRKVSQSQHALLVEQYRMALKTITDNLSNMQARTGKSWQKYTPDNPDWKP
jgi:hypothetical protein